MDTKSELTQAKDELLALLDSKFHNVVEWRAFRAVDRALSALGAPKNASVADDPAREINFPLAFGNSYTALAHRALIEGQTPLSTVSLMGIIKKHRDLDPDQDKAKNSIVSALSKDIRFRSVPWDGGRAWWFSDRAVPKKEIA